MVNAQTALTVIGITSGGMSVAVLALMAIGEMTTEQWARVLARNNNEVK